MGSDSILDIFDVGGIDGDMYLNYEGFNHQPNAGANFEGPLGGGACSQKTGSKKRVRDELCSMPGSKACREKMQRDRLNDRFLELGSILDPERPVKVDKTSILIDAARTLTQLQCEAKKLKDANERLQEMIKDLKAEKNELCEEKKLLKAEKEKLELQISAMNMAPTGYVPHPAALHAVAAFSAQASGPGSKAMPLAGYPGIAMWSYMPPAHTDTSQDPKLRPPAA